MFKKYKISSISSLAIVFTIVLILCCAFFGYNSVQQYKTVKESNDEYITAEEAIHKFEQGNNKLTKKVRLAAYTLKQQYIDDYFIEIDTIQSRENAIEELRNVSGDECASYLEDALILSENKVKNDLHALCLIETVIADDNTTWPNNLKEYKLTNEELALSDDEKIELARELINSESYVNANTFISNEISKTLDNITSQIVNKQNRSYAIFSDVFFKLLIVFVLLALAMFLNCTLLYLNVIKPLIDFNKAIKNDELMPVDGSQELRNLASSYNAIYIENQERQSIMKHKSEHDSLTNLLNRGSFDSILEVYEKDKFNFALLLIDVDNFKTVNDTYGHSIGDAILKKVADKLTSTFRTSDYVCRIGGDEFAVIMIEMTNNYKKIIAEKIDEVNKLLSISENGEPVISLSVGVAIADRSNASLSIFKDADSALYKTKEKGRNGYTFY